MIMFLSVLLCLCSCIEVVCVAKASYAKQCVIVDCVAVFVCLGLYPTWLALI